MSGGTRTTFKVTVAGRRVVDFSTLRKGDKFILQDDDPLLAIETGDVCNVATSDAYLRDGFWTIDCEEIEGSPVRRIKRTKRGSHPDDWNKPFTIKSSSKVTKKDFARPMFGGPESVLGERAQKDLDIALIYAALVEMEDERVLKALLSATQPIDSSFKQGQDVRLEVEQKMLAALGVSGFQVWENEGAYSVPVQFAEEVAALQSALGGEE